MSQHAKLQMLFDRIDTLVNEGDFSKAKQLAIEAQNFARINFGMGSDMHRHASAVLEGIPDEIYQNSPGFSKPALISCSACNHSISIEAEACPQCGHPNRNLPRTLGPRCYSCSESATTRCQACGALSCPVHVNSIYVHHGRGGAYELRCASCYESAQAWESVGCIVMIVIAAIALGMFMAISNGMR